MACLIAQSQKMEGLLSILIWLQSLCSNYSLYHFHYIGQEPQTIKFTLIHSLLSVEYSIWHRGRHWQQEHPGWALFSASHIYHLWQSTSFFPLALWNPTLSVRRTMCLWKTALPKHLRWAVQWSHLLFLSRREQIFPWDLLLSLLTL